MICLDETSKQLTREKRTPLPRGPGREERIDYEYERAGVANVFMLFVPLEGKRHVSVRKRRTAKDYADVVRELVDVHFPLAEKIVLVHDNLNTHKIASLYKAFPPAEALRIAERIEMHFTPKHGELYIQVPFYRCRFCQALDSMPNIIRLEYHIHASVNPMN